MRIRGLVAVLIAVGGIGGLVGCASPPGVPADRCVGIAAVHGPSANDTILYRAFEDGRVEEAVLYPGEAVHWSVLKQETAP